MFSPTMTMSFLRSRSVVGFSATLNMLKSSTFDFGPRVGVAHTAQLA